jgi:hypothetical protein
MRFTVPQFIEEEAKIIGPLAFKQVLYVGAAAVICFILYFLLPFYLFLICSIILIGGGSALAFLRIGGKSLPSVLANFLRYSLTSNIYIWKKSEQPAINIYKKEKKPPAEEIAESEEKLPLKIAAKSRLKKLQTKIETKTKK